MKDDVQCPYCGADNEIDHEDGYGCEEGQTFNQECCACDNTFAYTTEILLHHKARKADCLNGRKHEFISHPSGYPGYSFDYCEACGNATMKSVEL